MKIKSLLTISFIFTGLSSEVALSAPCDIMLDTEEKAKACLNWRLKNQGNGLYSKAYNDGHLGNLKNCETSSKGKDYFSEVKPEFLDTIGKVNIDSCVLGNKKWKCWGTTSGTRGCYAPDLTSRIFFSLNDGSNGGIIITFYPTAEKE